MIAETYFCRECGTRMESDYAFCPECGTSAAQYAAASQRAKIIMGSCLLAAVLLVGLYFAGKYMTDDARLIERFEKSVEEGNADKLFNLMSASNENNQFDLKTVDGIVNYLKSNSDVMANLTDQLKRQGKMLQSGEAEALGDTDDVAFVYLHKKDKKRWLIYNDYDLLVKRYMVPVQTNFEGAMILVDGKEEATASGDGAVIEVGPLFPGKYDMKSVFEGEYTTLENKQTVSLFPMESTLNTVKLELEGKYVNVHSNNPSARIYMDGKDIGLIVGGGQQLGPIAMDGSNKIYLEADYPWGTMKSEELPIDTDKLEFHIDGLDDAVKEDIMNATYDFLSSSMQSLQTMDASQLKHANADRLADQAYFIEALKVNAQKYKGSLNRMTVDLDSFVLMQLKDGGYSTQVNVKADYSEITYYMEDTDPVPVDGTIYTSYELVYEDGQWLVSNWSSVNGIGTEHTKEYK